jgi:hypothetical protein
MTFPALGTLVSPLIIGKGILDELPALKDFSAVSTDLQFFVVAELIVNGGLLVLSIYLLLLMLGRKRLYPKAFLLLSIGYLVFLAADIVVAQAFGVQVTNGDILSVVRMIGVCIVWGPYMLVSRRVKATFTN